jgi:hypothetical protein
MIGPLVESGWLLSEADVPSPEPGCDCADAKAGKSKRK